MPVLGIDTSNYTTSMALVDGRSVIDDCRIILSVPEGGRGLQQSNALFQHIKNLPVLMDKIGAKGRGISAIAASARPRPAEGSYMPVFMAGTSAGRMLASALSVPFFETSHQEGHIMAGCFSISWVPEAPFLAFHISGGTTELLLAKPTNEGFVLNLVGQTTDLHAGQVVDRVGVALGLRFPAGPALELLAAGHDGSPTGLPLKGHVSGADCSLSGLESAAQRQIAAGAASEAVAFEIQCCLADTFSAMAIHAAKVTGIQNLLVMGGVASNLDIRQRMTTTLGKSGITTRFAANPYSSDNAVGVAVIGQQFLR